MQQYKIIRAPTLDRLEVLVNAFLSSADSYPYDLLEGPQVFGHEEYIQAFISHTREGN